jgi:cell wall-associated NlpC family hydrolase
MSRRSSGPHRRAVALRARHLTLSLALGLVISATTSFAIPTVAGATTEGQLKDATSQARQLAAQMAANTKRADILDEQYLQARQSVADANNQIAATAKAIGATEARSRQLRSQLGTEAAMLYMGAGNGDPINVDVASVQDLASRSNYGAAAAAPATQIIGALTIADEELRLQQRDLGRQRAEAQKRQQAAESARRAVADANAQIQKLLDSANAQVRTLATKLQQEQLAARVAEERARIQRLVAAQQAAAQAAAQQAAAQHAAAQQAAAQQAAAQQAAPPPISNGGSGGTGVIIDPSTIPAPSPGAAAAVAYAYAQLGKPYQYAGVGPDSYDCSGLTMMAWAQGGVSMQHGSQSQYDSFPHIPISQLQPGDLVFFGDSGPTNHHVGIVVGGGMMIDAPHTGAFVEKVSYYWPDLVLMGARP